MAELQPCYIGSEKGESGHKTSLTKTIGFEEILNLDDSEEAFVTTIFTSTLYSMNHFKGYAVIHFKITKGL